MNAFRSRRPGKYRPFWIPVALFAFTTVILSSGIFAGELPRKKDANQAAEQIQIIADKLITNSAEKFAEFTGDVRTSQGDLVITSERLRIYYRDDAGRSKDQTAGQESIKRIVASGNVQISSEKYKAETDQVEYDPDTQVLVLSGENSTVTSGKNTLTGSKITVFRKTGQTKVEGSPHKQIKAVFYPEEKTSEPNPKE
ncbi:MAG: LptA/OstA family protein [Deltaproteobacteria bacterium]